MDLILSALGAAYTAFVIWLTVRIINRPDRRHRRLVALAIGLPLLYVLSFGPAAVLIDRHLLPRRATFRFYKPLLWNATEHDWPMAQYMRAWGIHQGWLRVQAYAIFIKDWPWPEWPEQRPVKPQIPNPDAPSESN